MAEIDTPRKEVVLITSLVLEQAEVFVKNGKLREAVTVIYQNRQSEQNNCNTSRSNKEEGVVLPPIVSHTWVDGGALLYNSMMSLREDPWLTLSLKETDNPDDKTIKKAFRELALKFHPDKSKFDSTDLFACIYSAYESIETEEKRRKFRIAREEEKLEKQAAKAAGFRAEKDLEKKYAKKRMVQERESLEKWRSTQKVTFAKWESDDHEIKLQQVERERCDRRREFLEKERRQRGSKMEVEKMKRREQHRKDQSNSIQKKLQAEEDEARSMIALLEKQRKELLDARNKAKKTSMHDNKDLVKLLVPSSTSSRTKKKSITTTTSATTIKTSTSTGNSKTSSGTSGRVKTTCNTAPISANPPLEYFSELVVTFNTKGMPMGFTLIDQSSEQANKVKNKESLNPLKVDDVPVSDKKQPYKQELSTVSKSSIHKQKKDKCDWAASVLKLEYETETGKCEAAELGVLEGDTIIAINGYETKGMRFSELCTFLGKSTYPRSLTFRRSSKCSTQTAIEPELS